MPSACIQEESGFLSPPPADAPFPEGISVVAPLYESASGKFRILSARHFNRKVILKCPGEAHRDDPLAITQLKKEFNLGFGVSHPGVVATLALHTLPEYGPAIELEYCEGSDLRTLLDSETPLRLDARQTERIVSDLLDALRAIHTSGITHRDLKPSNIIYDPLRSQVKIIDFGCADSADHLQLKSPAGTPRYTPAESADGSRPPLPADDLYALGMTLLELAPCVADREASRRLRRFARNLTAGLHTTADEALAAFSKPRHPRRLLVMVAAALPLLILLLIGLPPLMHQSAREETSPLSADARPSDQPMPDLTAATPLPPEREPESNQASNQASDPASNTVLRPQAERAGAERAGAERAGAPVSKGNASTAPGQEAASPSMEAIVTSSPSLPLPELAIYAGALLRRYDAGEATAGEQADAIAIRAADDLYHNSLMHDFLRKKFTKEEIKSMANYYTSVYSTDLSQRLKTAGLHDADRQRARQLYYHRLHYHLTTSHLAR